MTQQSRVTVTVPAALPNKRTDVKTNASDTDIVADTERNLMLIDPVGSVSPANANHWDVTGCIEGKHGMRCGHEAHCNDDGH